VLKNFRNIDRAVNELLSGGRLAEMKARIAAIENRAVYEVPAILARILALHSPS
jgi:1,2-diacylglycerol 3-beta-galactosyltransferase